MFALVASTSIIDEIHVSILKCTTKFSTCTCCTHTVSRCDLDSRQCESFRSDDVVSSARVASSNLQHLSKDSLNIYQAPAAVIAADSVCLLSNIGIIGEAPPT